MTPKFKPPVGATLVLVDLVDVEYEDGSITIEGVVSPSGQSAWAGRDENFDVHCFEFAAWRQLGEKLIERELTLLRAVPPSRNGESRGEDIFARFPDYSIERLSVLLSKDRTRAIVETVVPKSGQDQDLLGFAERLRQPVVITTKHFGDLLLNRRVNWFEGKANWNGKTIEIYCSRNSDNGIEEAIQTAERLWSDQGGWKRKVEDFAVQELLPILNQAWLDDGEAEVTADQFKSRTPLVAIKLAADGSFEFWHEDGDMFAGHSIEVRGSLAEGLTEATIAG
jgi:hypothetical protein